MRNIKNDNQLKQKLILELQRVAKLTDNKHLTVEFFRKNADFSPDTIRRNFGSWETALKTANLATHYSGRVITDKMLNQIGKHSTDIELLRELRTVAKLTGKTNFTQNEFKSSSKYSPALIVRRFKSWKSAMTKAGLEVSNLGKRYTTNDYLNNMLVVWQFHKRQPKYRDMDFEPSKITSGAYERKFGKWSNAISEFMKNITSVSISSNNKINQTTILASNKEVKRDKRDISLSLRYKVLKRDNFCCVLCGNSPAKNISCELHIDHIVPWVKGGKTELENLRTTCSNCNIGKSDR